MRDTKFELNFMKAYAITVLDGYRENNKRVHLKNISDSYMELSVGDKCINVHYPLKGTVSILRLETTTDTPKSILSSLLQQTKLKSIPYKRDTEFVNKFLDKYGNEAVFESKELPCGTLEICEIKGRPVFATIKHNDQQDVLIVRPLDKEMRTLYREIDRDLGEAASLSMYDVFTQECPNMVCTLPKHFIDAMINTAATDTVDKFIKNLKW